jgi:hypothetical protein
MIEKELFCPKFIFRKRGVYGCAVEYFAGRVGCTVMSRTHAASSITRSLIERGLKERRARLSLGWEYNSTPRCGDST